MSRECQAIVDLDALKHNLSVAKRYAGKAKVQAVIKANAYGHGAAEVARALSDDSEMFCLASLEEATELRHGGIDKPMLLLSGVNTKADYQTAAQLSLDTVIHNKEQISTLLATPLDQKIRVWLKLDTGMHRLGISPEETRPTFDELSDSQQVESVRLMSHFANADDPASSFTRQQIEKFNQHTNGLNVETSLCNSAGLIAFPEARRDWVRPGIMLYGVNPFATDHPAAKELKPVMHLQAKLIAMRSVPKGEGVGYGQCWIAERESIIGTVAIGYGDGYPRHAPNGTPVLVNGKLVPLAGRVSMDTIGIDLTDTPGARIGDKVTLWGPGLPAYEIASLSGTIAYELFTGVTARVPREYIGS